MVFSYDAKGVFNIQKIIFEEVDENTTKLISYNEFQFIGFMILIGFLMQGAFEKKPLKHMLDFKAFDEEGKSIRHN